MQEDKPPNRWAELNDKAVIEVMHKDGNSEYWRKCDEYIQYFIGTHFRDLSQHLKADIAQEAMLSVHKGLPSFRHESKFTTWLTSIARNRAIDVLRKFTATNQSEKPLQIIQDGQDVDIKISPTNPPKTPEEIVISEELLYETFNEIEKRLKTHKNPARNREILHMVFIEEFSCAKTAKILNVPAPVVAYVRRTARSYLKQKFGKQS